MARKRTTRRSRRPAAGPEAPASVRPTGDDPTGVGEAMEEVSVNPDPVVLLSLEYKPTRLPAEGQPPER